MFETKNLSLEHSFCNHCPVGGWAEFTFGNDQTCSAKSHLFHIFRDVNLLLLTSKSATLFSKVSQLALISLQLVCSQCTSGVLHHGLSTSWEVLQVFLDWLPKKRRSTEHMEQGCPSNKCHWPNLHSPLWQSGQNPERRSYLSEKRDILKKAEALSVSNKDWKSLGKETETRTPWTL